jgi:hypothetical protein
VTRELAITTLQHSDALQWLWLLGFFALLGGVTGWLFLTGSAGTSRGLLRAPVARIGDSLRRVTGLPTWCAAGLALSMWALLVALIGFLWDVAWHIDLGRDAQLFTVPHTLILTGLMGIGLSALVSIMYATIDGADTAWRLGTLRIPRGAFALGVLSAGAACGFPLDDLWHANYGVDVTMWGPTHLMMIGGASLAPIAQWLLYTEAGRNAGRAWVQRHVRHTLAASTVLGLSTFQLEFDYGVPQWQALYQPVLIMLATSIALVAARVAFGRGGAVLMSLNFVGARTLMALVVGPGLGHVVPRFPLYVGIGLAIEGGAWLARRRGSLVTALACGGAAATLGLATEWGFSHLWGRHPWQLALIPGLWDAVLVAVAGAVIGVALGRVVSHRRAGMPKPLLAAAFAAVAVGLVVPLPRNTAPMTAVMRTTPVGSAVAAVNRDGLPSPLQEYAVDLVVSPRDAAVGADWFEALSWQGGGMRSTSMVEVRPGDYRTASTVPGGGTWKTVVWLARRDVMMSVPVAFPLDLEYGQAPIVPKSVQLVRFVASTSLLMRETHGGAAWPMILAYGGLLGVTLLWIGVLVAGFASVERGPGAGGGRVRRVRLRGVRAEAAPRAQVGVG